MFEYIADHPALDFLPTVAARGSLDEEKLRTPADLEAWIVGSGLVDTAPPVSDAGLPRAKAVREAMYRLIAALIDGRPAAEADVADVERSASAPLPRLRVDPAGVHREGDLTAVLAALARDCLELHGPDRADLRWCDDPTCTRAFVDRSRGHRRRWCGMKGCGDRAKAAAYRSRKRAVGG